MAGNILRIPHFLAAGDPLELQRLMLKNNTFHGKEFNYSTPQFVKGKWYVWYSMVLNVKGKVNVNG